MKLRAEYLLSLGSVFLSFTTLSKYLKIKIYMNIILPVVLKVCVKLGRLYWWRNVDWRCLRIRCWEYLGLRVTRWHGREKNYIIMSLMLYIPHSILFGWWNQEEWDGLACRTYRWKERSYGFWWGNLRGNYLEDPGVDGRIILRWVFGKWYEGPWTGSMCLRIGTGGGHLWMR